MSRASDASEGKHVVSVSSMVICRTISGQILNSLTATYSGLSLVQMVLVTTFYLLIIITFSPLAATMHQYVLSLCQYVAGLICLL